MSDLISRSALIENVAHLGKTEDLTTELKPGAKEIFNAISWHIDQAPAVDAVPVVHGRWVLEEMTFDVDGNPMFPCSECKALSYAHADGRMYNYCHNCGADMRGDESEK